MCVCVCVCDVLPFLPFVDLSLICTIPRHTHSLSLSLSSCPPNRPPPPTHTLTPSLSLSLSLSLSPSLGPPPPPLSSERLTERATEFWIMLDDVSITDLQFGTEYSKAVENKQIAQQEAQRAALLVEQARQARQQKIVEAEGEAKAAELIGKV